MFSVTNTGMNFRPLCTAKVCPTNSGRMVDRRDQVFTTFFWFPLMRSSTFFRRWASTKGPFLIERATGSPLLLAPDAAPAPADDELVGPLVLPGAEALGLLAPGRDRVRVPLAALALATAVRVVDRVHGQTAHGGAC